MRWLLFISKKEMDIKKAFQFSDYLDIKQSETYTLKDIVYLFVEDSSDKIILKYVCEVSESNIEEDGEKFYYDNLVQSRGLDLIEFFTRLKLKHQLESPIYMQQLREFGLNEPPVFALREIGENRTIFKKIDEILITQDNKPESSKVSLLRHEDSRYFVNRSKFLEIIRESSWENISNATFLKLMGLLSNEMNDMLEPDEYQLVLYDSKEQGHYSRYGNVFDIDKYIKELEKEIVAFLEEGKTDPLLGNFSLGKLFISSYVYDHTAFYGDTLKTVCSKLSIHESDAIIANKLISEKVRENINPYEEASGFDIYEYLSKVYNLKLPKGKSSENKQELATYTLISSNDEDNIRRLLKEHKNVLLLNTQIIAGSNGVYDFIKKIVRFDEAISRNFGGYLVDNPWHFQAVIIDINTIDTEQLSRIAELTKRENIYVIVNSYGVKIDSKIEIIRSLLSDFYQYTIEANVYEDFRKFLSNFIYDNETIKNIVEDVNRVNEVILSNKCESVLSLDLFKKFDGTTKSWIDIVQYRLKPALRLNELSDDDYRFCDDQLGKILKRLT